MEIKNTVVVAFVLATLCMIASAMNIPAAPSNDVQMDDDSKDLSGRATWLDTRELEDGFKDMVLYAMQELAEEGRIAANVVENNPPKQKRGRWQGFCFRRTRSGRFLPYICWKGDESK